MLIQRDKFENSILEYDLIKRIIAILRFHQNNSKNNLTKHTAKCKVIQNIFLNKCNTELICKQYNQENGF